MNITEQIQAYISSQPEQKRNEIAELHELILKLMPKCKLWFLDGKDEKGKTVSNPNIGYGFRTALLHEPYQDGLGRGRLGACANIRNESVRRTGSLALKSVRPRRFIVSATGGSTTEVWSNATR